MRLHHKLNSSARTLINMTLLSVAMFWANSCAYATERITVAVASSLYTAIQQQAQRFEKEHDVSIHLIPGSTGRLYNQIMQGAPFDLLIAADDERPALLQKAGKATTSIAVGKGYVGIAIGCRVVRDVSQLKAAAIRHIAIANPDVAPFGQVSKHYLQQQGLWKILTAKFVYAQNALQATMMVNKGLVDAAFIPVTAHDYHIATITYRAVLLTNKPYAHAFLQALPALGGGASAPQESL
ncbi:MAG: molybdate ABC transporter substrate-binding protein [Mariprofundus sp.]|nr:molybdate ABC transporter substrate-binding protein [Mariprofundus sp.]